MLLYYINIFGRAFQVYEGIKRKWEEDRDFLSVGTASTLFDRPTLDVTLSYTKKKHL